jgi:hypothetical protein
VATCPLVAEPLTEDVGQQRAGIVVSRCTLGGIKPEESDHFGRFEVLMITDDEERHVFAPSPAAMVALVAVATAETVLLWDPEGPSVIAANIVGRMPWTDTFRESAS